MLGAVVGGEQVVAEVAGGVVPDGVHVVAVRRVVDLDQRARAGEMLFSDAVKNLLDKRGVDVGAMPLPSLILRGRSSPIGIFCVPTATAEPRVDFRPN